ncbi:MAG: type II toxin-antitoxin system RelE/ParE family toxin [Propionibacteriaceae bacterium]|nr:type II toxin-antitoxin system RelE/ParE family toxin [Propionibacteriaceae bacterium]
MTDAFSVTLSKQARRALREDLPEAVAVACFEFIRGPLAENPYRVGKPLHAPLAGHHSARRGEFRVIYQIHDRTITVHVVSIKHRRDAYHR